MYQDKLACAIKVGGKVLREQGSNVFLPFGSEYSFLIKNLNNTRVCVHISIDGQDVVDGGLVINANSSTELERFVKASQLAAGNRFKFIERNASVEKARGIGVEDGLIRIEYEFEKTIQYQPPYQLWQPPTIYGGSIGDDLGASSSLGRSYSSGIGGAASSGVLRSSSASTLMTKGFEPQNDAGITVPGSVSNQTFTSTTFSGVGTTSVMVIKLLGEIQSQPVAAPVIVRSKQKCVTCNHVNKTTAKYCSECGTGLEII